MSHKHILHYMQIIFMAHVLFYGALKGACVPSFPFMLQLILTTA